MSSLDKEYARLASLTDDELYYEIGVHLQGRSIMPIPRGALIERANKWCDKTLAPVICAEPRIRSLAKQDLSTHEKFVAITGILDIVALHVLGVVPTITVAALIVRIGVHRLCSSYWASLTDQNDA